MPISSRMAQILRYESMWNKRSFLLMVRIRLRGVKPNLNLLLPLAFFALRQWLLAFDGALALIPGKAGRQAQSAADTIHAMLLQLMCAKPQTIADVKVSNKKQQVRVLVRTIGLRGGGEA